MFVMESMGVKPGNLTIEDEHLYARAHRGPGEHEKIVSQLENTGVILVSCTWKNAKKKLIKLKKVILFLIK